ncbi:hypothetical protein BH11MYX2_BH11MYX2_12650 [soil metagenome]
MDAIDEELAALGAVLVEQRVLRRIIKQHRKVRGFGLQVPHEDCYTLRRGDLVPLVESDEIVVPLDTLPELLAVVHGDRALLAKVDAPELVRVWRTLFHARLHQALDARALTAALVRARVQRVGQTEFDEIRSVLAQEDLLLPPVDPISTYVEFAALYLELRHFAPDVLARTFPAVFDQKAIDATLALDVDAAALLAVTCPSRAPSLPIIEVVADTSEPPPPELVQPTARGGAIRAQLKRNHVRAAILFARSGDRSSAAAELDVMATQLAQALGATAQEWTVALLPVATFAARYRSLWFNPGARLLYDLQAAAMVTADDVKVVDVLGWALSIGKQKIVRALPATREVRIAKHVHAAVAKIAACNLPRPQDRARLSKTIHAIAGLADSHLRATLRPTILRALDAVELHPHSLPERVGEKNLVDELLDRAVAIGRLSLGDLRDALSRNDLKMPDLALEDLARGDQLLRADQILATSIDGVYRRGEIYMRGLQKISSILFGTRIGRFLTLYFMLPLLVAYATVQGLQHMVGPLWHALFHHELVIATNTTLLAGTALVFLLLHVAPFRHAMYLGVRGLWRVTRFILFDLPLAALRLPVIRWVLASRFVRWMLKPAVPAVSVWLLTPMLLDVLRWGIAGGVLLIVMAFLNSGYGRRAEEIALDWLVRSSRQVTSRVLPGLVSITLELFARLVERFDRFLYRVDEWLRFRTGQSTLKLVFKGVVGVVWAVITYFLRLYVNLFIEPTTNPIKHFPVVTVAAKIMLPFIPAILSGITGPAAVLLGPQLGRGFAAFTVLVLPGLAGFLVWELKENWNLYQRARSKIVRPLAIGHHGETMVRLLRPGFHSGTIPKLFTKRRRAAWRHDPGASDRAVEGLHHVEEAVVLFVDRHLVSMLDESVAFAATDVATKHVEIGSNRIMFDLACPSISDETTSIRFDMQSGWLVASIHTLGWVARLPADQRQIFEIALAGFYTLAGVDIVREQIDAALVEKPGMEPPPYDVSDEGIVVWPDGTYETEILYVLHSSRAAPVVRGALYSGPVIDLVRRRALFGREHLYWATWSAMWQRLARGEEPRPVIVGPSLVG